MSAAGMGRERRRARTGRALEAYAERGLRARDDRDVLGLGALVALLDLELDRRALGEGLEALAADRREVDEDVLAAVARGDESIALGVVEPLDSYCCHLPYTSSCQLRERAEEAHCARPIPLM